MSEKEYVVIYVDKHDKILNISQVFYGRKESYDYASRVERHSGNDCKIISGVNLNVSY